MTDFQLLAAMDIGDWIKVVFGIVFVLVYLVNQLVAGQKQAAQGKAAERPKPPPQRAPERAAQADEVEQFLRAAAEARRRQQQQQQRPPAPPQKGGTVRRPKPPKKPKSPVPTLARQEAPAERLGAQVERALSTKEFEVRAAQMDDDLEQLDRDRAAHRSKMFEHQVGNLAPASPAASVPTVSTAGAASPAAGMLAAALASPQDLRKAIILYEILQRPEERW
jgi:hypothetical protein